MRSFLFIALVLGACDSGSSKPPPKLKLSGLENRPTASQLQNLGQPPELQALAAVVTKLDTPSDASGRCREGWSATKTEWMGMGAMTVTVACKGGVPTLTLDDKEPRGETTTSSKAISRDVWEALWKQLEVASWRDLASGCPELAVPSPLAMGITDLELEITDGKATKKLECSAMNLTSQHDVIMKAFDKAAGIADDEPST